MKEPGGRTRLNTDGHGNVINKRNIVPELVGLIDAVSISLNSTDPVQYGALMRLDGAAVLPGHGRVRAGSGPTASAGGDDDRGSSGCR